MTKMCQGFSAWRESRANGLKRFKHMIKRQIYIICDCFKVEKTNNVTNAVSAKRKLSTQFLFHLKCNLFLLLSCILMSF